jgi:transposase-like protein
MGQILHGCARTTQAVRREIQNSKASLNTLATKFGINPKTVAKWKKRAFVTDLAMGPKVVRSTVLSREEEAAVVAFRKHTLLPLDDCLYALQEAIPHLSRSSLHRCFQRHDISRLPKEQSDPSTKKKFKQYPIGYFHVDIAEVQTEEGRLYLFVAIDRTSKFAYVELHARQGKMEAAAFLRNLFKAVPYKIHTILTDNGIQFTNRKQDRLAFMHIFDRICFENNTEHRCTKISHPWTNGQVERMNRTIKEATVKRYHYQTHDSLRRHIYHFLNAYNFAKRLKALKGKTPYEFIVDVWKKEPKSFIVEPNHFIVGLNT